MKPKSHVSMKAGQLHFPGQPWLRIAGSVVCVTECWMRSARPSQRRRTLMKTGEAYGTRRQKDHGPSSDSSSRGLVAATTKRGSIPPDRRDWRHIRTFETRFDAGGVARSGLAVFKWPDDPSDEDSRSVLSAPQSLRDHAEQVADCTRALARRLELPEDEADALVLAARMGLRCQATGRERRWASFSADHMNTVEPETASCLLANCPRRLC